VTRSDGNDGLATAAVGVIWSWKSAREWLVGANRMIIESIYILMDAAYILWPPALRLELQEPLDTVRPLIRLCPFGPRLDSEEKGDSGLCLHHSLNQQAHFQP
jgi:hypothetical protein